MGDLGVHDEIPRFKGQKTWFNSVPCPRHIVVVWCNYQSGVKRVQFRIQAT